MNRKSRLQSARHWIPSYKGKDLVRGYRKKYGVDRLAALIELQMCGQAIKQALIDEERARLAMEASKKAKQAEPEVGDEWPYPEAPFADVWFGIL